jgi:hypothetical protein
MAERFASALGPAFLAGAGMAAMALLIALRLPPLVRSPRVVERGALPGKEERQAQG